MSQMNDPRSREEQPDGEISKSEVPKMSIDELVAACSAKPVGEAFRLALSPGRASAEDIVRLLNALSNLDIAAGGGGLEFSLIGMSGTYGLWEMRPVVYIEGSFSTAEVKPLMDLGSYSNLSKFVEHSIEVSRCILKQHGSKQLFWQSDFSHTEFDVLEFDQEFRIAPTSQSAEDPWSNETLTFCIRDNQNFRAFMDMGEFRDPIQAISFAVTMFSNILEGQSQGWTLVYLEGQDFLPFMLPAKP